MADKNPIPVSIEIRSIPGEMKTRADENGELIIEGYFAVFNSVYQMWPDVSEEMMPGAFTETIARDDIRALVNHDTTLVIGRNTIRTLELREDERGLFGRIVINPKDSDAVNIHARVERGDVSQCSIGFDIIREDTEVREDGSVHYRIRQVKLWEVSVCTFPAYEETGVKARSKEHAEVAERRQQAWKEKMIKRLKGES